MFTFVQSDPGDLLLPILCPVLFVRFDSLNMFSLAHLVCSVSREDEHASDRHPQCNYFLEQNLVQFKSADTYQHMI